jgi:hypothetical protein
MNEDNVIPFPTKNNQQPGIAYQQVLDTLDDVNEHEAAIVSAVISQQDKINKLSCDILEYIMQELGDQQSPVPYSIWNDQENITSVLFAAEAIKALLWRRMERGHHGFHQLADECFEFQQPNVIKWRGTGNIAIVDRENNTLTMVTDDQIDAGEFDATEQQQ